MIRTSIHRAAFAAVLAVGCWSTVSSAGQPVSPEPVGTPAFATMTVSIDDHGIPSFTPPKSFVELPSGTQPDWGNCQLYFVDIPEPGWEATCEAIGRPPVLAGADARSHGWVCYVPAVQATISGATPGSDYVAGQTTCRAEDRSATTSAYCRVNANGSCQNFGQRLGRVAYLSCYAAARLSRQGARATVTCYSTDP